MWPASTGIKIEPPLGQSRFGIGAKGNELVQNQKPRIADHAVADGLAEQCTLGKQTEFMRDHVNDPGLFRGVQQCLALRRMASAVLV